MGVVDLEAQKF